MQEIFIYIGFLIGVPILIKSSDYTVNFAIKYSEITGISKSGIGAIIVATLTSLPELFVAIASISLDAAGIILGNVLGANIANVLLLLGICGVLFEVTVKNKRRYLKIIITSIIPLICGLIFGFNFLLGLLCILLFSIQSKNLLISKIKRSKKYYKKEEGSKILPKLLLSGFILLISAELIVVSIKNLSIIIGFSETIFAALMLSLATTLPELSVSITSAKRKEYDLLLGNILGSCFVNINLILGISLIFSKFIISSKEIFLMLANFISYLVFIVLSIDSKIERMEALIMLLIFVLYASIGFTLI